VVLTNPYKKLVEVVKAAWVMRRADGTEQELPTEINCLNAANGTAVIPRSIIIGNITQDGMLLCDWKVQVPEAHSGEMRLNVTTADDSIASSPAVASNWTAAVITERNSCARVFSYFHQTQPATLVLPFKVEGIMPPEASKAVKMCSPLAYQFKARFGPFPADGCRLQQALVYAGFEVEDTKEVKQDNQPLYLKVTGCPSPAPTVRMASAVPANITSTYSWSIKRQSNPVTTEPVTVNYDGNITYAGTS